MESGDELSNGLAWVVASAVEAGAFIRDVTGCYKMLAKTSLDDAFSFSCHFLVS